MIKGLIEKIWIKNKFSKYVNKKILNNIEKSDNKLKKPVEKECGYILLEIIQNEYFDLTLSNLIDYSKNKNIIYDIYGTIMLFFISKVLWNENKDIIIKNIINEFINNIPEDIMKNIRCIHGVENAKIGFFGNNERSAYMALLNNFYEKIIKINELNIGEIKEI